MATPGKRARRRRQRLRRRQGGNTPNTNRGRRVRLPANVSQAQQMAYPFPQARLPVSLSGPQSTMSRQNRLVPRSRRRGNFRVANGNTQLPKFPLALVDPFSVDAFGVKLPDPDTNMSTTFRLKSTWTQPFDANGVCVAVIVPDPSSMIIATATTAATPAWTFAANWTAQNPWPQLAGIQAIYGAARVVSGGIAVRNVGGATSSGMITAAPIFIDSKLTGYSAALPLNVAEIVQLPNSIRCPTASLVNNELVMLFDKASPNANDYRSLAASWLSGGTAFESVLGCNAIIVAATGGASTYNAFDIEICINYEVLAVNQSGNPLANVTPPAASRPNMMAAADNLMNSISMSRIVDDAGVEEEDFISQVEGAWVKAVQIATSVADVAEVVSGLGALLL